MILDNDQNIYYQIIEILKITKYNASHWFRYLRKYITDEYTLINDEVFQKLRKSNSLTNFQKASLKYALIDGSKMNEYIKGLNRKTTLPNLRKVMEKYGIQKF